MKSFNGEKLLYNIVGRLVPPDVTFPDCLCEIILTEKTLYVLEDDFNDEYTVHFEIPLDHIINMERYINTDAKEQSDPKDSNDLSDSKNILGSLFGVLGGVYSMPRKRQPIYDKNIYLKIITLDGDNEKYNIYFKNIYGNMKKLIKIFNNYSHFETT